MEKHQGSRTSPAGTGCGPSPREDLSDLEWRARAGPGGCREVTEAWMPQPWERMCPSPGRQSFPQLCSAGNSKSNPKPRRAPVLVLPVPRDGAGFTLPRPTADFGCCLQPPGRERKISALTSATAAGKRLGRQQGQGEFPVRLLAKLLPEIQRRTEGEGGGTGVGMSLGAVLGGQSQNWSQARTGTAGTSWGDILG